jgi:hypothetical protein
MRAALLLIGSAAASSDSSRTRLSFWVEGPVNAGCKGWGMPFPGFSPEAKAEPSCWNNTLGHIAQHAAVIDELQLVVGFLVTNVSSGLIDLDRDGSKWAPGFRERPLDWFPHWVPELLAVLRPGTRIMAALDFGGGAFGDPTAVASDVYAHADALAAQMVQLATTHDWIDGYTVDYEAYVSNVPQEASNLAALFQTVSSALHAHGKALHFCTNQNGAGFEHWPYYQRYLDAGVDRLLEMGTYCNHTRSGGPSDRDSVTRTLLKFPLDRTAFGLGDYRPLDTAAEARAWLDELLDLSRGMPGQLAVHVYDLFGARPTAPGYNCTDRAEFDHHCARPAEPWWPILERFHSHAGRPV